MKIRSIAVGCLVALCGCAAEPAKSSGGLADRTFLQEIGKPKQPLFSPDCPVQ